MAFKIDFKTTCKLGTPDTSFNGLSTLTARKVLRSNPTPSLETRIVMKPVTTTVKSIIFQTLLK